jgi:xanthine dehydrogenase accessory factor
MLNELCTRLAAQDAVLVSIVSSQGSVPRDAGAWMAVFADSVLGTIGGGHVEFQAIADARRRLAGQTGDNPVRYALGPSLGQCCGGAVHLRFERVGTADVTLLQVDADTLCELSDPVQAAVAALAPGTPVLIMSFSHAEDLDVVAACLARLRQHDDLPYIGLIGSATKWATFRKRLQERGYADAELARVTCPIGLSGIRRKEPEVIAVGVAAQLLQLESSSQP